jgi:hypothetical protein
MTAAEQASLDTQLAAEAQDRTKLLAQLAREAAKSGAKPGKWTVYRQLFVGGEVVEQATCSHRFAWVGQLCVHRRERQHAHEAGGHYTVRRADA